MPAGNEVVVIDNVRELITKATFAVAVCLGLELSVSVTAKVKLPMTVGVPLKTPAALRLSPAGTPVAAQV